MKRMFVVTVALLLAVSLFAIAGCGGGDTDLAKQYMDTADSALAAWQEDADALSSSSDALIGAAMTGDTANIDPAQISGLEAEMDRVMSDLTGVMEDYEKMLPLEGVPDYVAYAEAMIAYLEAEQKVIEAGQALYSKVAPAIAQLVETGDTSALTAAVQEMAGELDKLEGLEKTADEALKKAQDIKKDKEL